MKLSVSLSEEDVMALDAYVQRLGLPSRSAGVQRAIRALAHSTLEADYALAWDEWSATGEEEAWAPAAEDGLDNASR